MTSCATILCYHKVGPKNEEGRRLNIDPARLESHVRYFARRRPTCLAREFGEDWPAGAVCFTFDDAYLSTITHAPDLFERHGARGTFYAVPGRVGLSSDWDGPAARPLADWDALLDAQRRGHEIGNHTLNHPHLDQIDPAEQLREIAEAHEQLLAHGIRSESFCYPYGGLNDSAVAAVGAAGYRVGMALRKRAATADEDRLALSRIVVAFSDALPMLLYRLHIRPLLKKKAR
jgi:peptidoglycan/xylan/chitin deacetylase (PgdA/CDA1 family)